MREKKNHKRLQYVEEELVVHRPQRVCDNPALYTHSVHQVLSANCGKGDGGCWEGDVQEHTY